MKLPDKVMILGEEFHVKLESLTGHPETAGLSHDLERIIKVNKDYPSAVQLETFYHEVVHMWLRLMGLGHVFKDGEEEAIAQAVGFALYKFLDENKQLPKKDVK